MQLLINYADDGWKTGRYAEKCRSEKKLFFKLCYSEHVINLVY